MMEGLRSELGHVGPPNRGSKQVVREGSETFLNACNLNRQQLGAVLCSCTKAI